MSQSTPTPICIPPFLPLSHALSAPSQRLLLGVVMGPVGTELPPQGLARVGRCLSLGVSLWAVQLRRMSSREPDSSCHHG